MLPLSLGARRRAPTRVLAIGAHPDDIEIGCGGTLLKLVEQDAISEVCWVVLSGEGKRAEEARESAEALLEGVPRSEAILMRDFPDGFFPYEGAADQGFLRGAEGRLLPGRHLHAPARRPPPGSPSRAAS